jgi:GDP-L-fucose synthase
MRTEGSTVVVTGGTGFLGRHVVDELQSAGATAVGVGRKEYDLRAREPIHQLLRDHRPDALIHLAATVGGIGANLAEPARFFYENALMGIELLEACRDHVEKVVLAGTVCAYPKYAKLPFREDEIWDGYPEETNAPYGLAKKMLLVQSQAYRAQYDLNSIYLLPVNLYGPGDNFDLSSGHVIPSMIRRFLEARNGGAREVVLWGDGSPTREFLHVKDAARAFRLALELYDNADPVNIGSEHEITISDLAQQISNLVGYTGSVTWDTSKPNGQPRRKVDTSRARTAFGFEASIDLATGLAETLAWYEGRGSQRS